MALINGTYRSETITGTSSGDTIHGQAGDDILFGYEGNDLIYGNSGDDDLWGGSGINNLYGGTGDDYFILSSRQDQLSDTYIGDFDFDEDTIDVSAWGVSDFSQIKALLSSDDNNDAVFNAYYNGLNHFVTIGGVAVDELQASDFRFSKDPVSEMMGTSRADILFGSSDFDILEGGGGNDRILGGGGNDRIYGDSGNDKIVGGKGADTMTGGSGSDSFVFAATNEMGSKSSTRDRITDFKLDVDLIDLSQIDALPKASGNQEFDWIGRTDDFDAAGQLSYIWSGKNTIILGNLDKDSSAEFQISLNGNLKLIADDFVL